MTVNRTFTEAYILCFFPTLAQKPAEKWRRDERPDKTPAEGRSKLDHATQAAEGAHPGRVGIPETVREGGLSAGGSGNLRV